LVLLPKYSLPEPDEYANSPNAKLAGAEEPVERLILIVFATLFFS
jgi:hypothetical protein